MCGIAGLISLNDMPVESDSIRQMVVALKHRGPDAQTIHVDGPVALGHARLSIIDLAAGHQPLFNEDRSIAVVCNGEIYNYRELRSQLVQRGHQFRTGSDCEVLTHLWEERGARMVDELRGMFAFILFDRRRGIVFGARDRFGQKPLFYALSENRIAFASEIKGLLVLPDVSRELDQQGLDQFLFHQYVPQPRTLFAGIKKLTAGSCFEIQVAPDLLKETPLTADSPDLAAGDRFRVSSGRDRFAIRSFWRPEIRPDRALSDAEHLDRVDRAVADAVESHLVADVPVGVFLSGGIDSSLITALAARATGEPLQTFSVSFPRSEHDEAPYAKAVAERFRTRHHEIPFQPADMKAVLVSAATLFDQPLADMAVLPLMALSQAASEHVKVVLTGDGGDELFAGYRKYKRMAGIPGRFRWVHRASSELFPIPHLAACRPDRLGLRKLQARLAMAVAPACRSQYQRQSWEGWERHSLYQPELTEKLAGRFEALNDVDQAETSMLDPLNLALRQDQGTCLADRLLLKGDYATMASGLEARAPLLDHLLADVAGRLPLHLKATSQTTKVALREIARRYLPAEIISRRKKGFSMPLDRWFRGELAQWTRQCLIDDSVTRSRYFQRQAVERLLAEHAAGKNHAARIHTLLTFELWSRAYAA
ncbi:asparagine synthase (glutamine-hydrolyzing) [Schlesneria sp. T3-172]|uniref:asparagine synthase (glutamine-hydrolyzing) n=1 Tax=Schlesneria sphaerica TaxID=3373610 RepID=UPI0037C8BEDB